VLALVGAASCGDQGSGAQWCGIRKDATQRLESCYQKLDTCEEKHHVTGSGGALDCVWLERAFCDPKRMECYPTRELCDKGLRETRSRPREHHDGLTGKVTRIEPAGPNDPVPACREGWPLKMLGQPD